MKTCSTHGQWPGDFCSVCGEKLQEVPNPQVDLPSPMPYEIFGEQPCPSCKYELHHGHQLFCPGCGHALLYTCR